MGTPTTTLTVSLHDDAVLLRVSGRAICTAGCDFKKLTDEMLRRGYRRFLIDLQACDLMDSTFLGLLADLGIKGSEGMPEEASPRVKLFNPNQRVTEILDQLGISHLFEIVRSGALPQMNGDTVVASPAQYSRAEVSRTCLEAHRLLMELNPENVARFKEVTRFLAEDLQKAEAAS
jgi:anti-anti-sigma regulatory factor